MKISLRWALEHIDRSSLDNLFDVKDLAMRVNQSVVEIEHFSQLKIDQKKIFAAKITASTDSHTTVFCQELKESITLKPFPSDLSNLVEQIVLIKQVGKNFEFLTLCDIGGDKDSLVPLVSIPDWQLSGAWKSEVCWEDIIFDVDNKSLTNRPDMWCHRGFAREFAMILDSKLIPEDQLLKIVPTISKPEFGQLKDPQSGLCVTVNSSSCCSYYAALAIKEVEYTPSNVKHVFNLAKVGFKPINLIVDLTNYVCADWGQPMHAFDAQYVQDKEIVVREAVEGEVLATLDSRELVLSSLDTVISDTNKTLALAGIIGGQESKITEQTTSIILESATFNAASIRKSALRHKIRTESSMRFEKTMDKTRAKEGVYRFIQLAKKAGLNIKTESSLLCVGTTEEPLSISVRHDFIEKKLGITLSKNDVVKTLENLEFRVLLNDDMDYATIYEVQVPSWRLSKDIKIEEDIVEEVARCYGFDKIKPELPNFTRQISLENDITDKIKDFLVYSMDMTEQYNYCFNDVDFCATIGHNPESDIFVLNPVNKNTKYLTKSLIPGLLKNVKTNSTLANDLRFFEIANTWGLETNDKIVEKELVAGVFVCQTGQQNAEQIKSRLFKLFPFLEIDDRKVEVSPEKNAEVVWGEKLGTYECFYQAKKIGSFGVISKKVVKALSMDNGNGFFFEFDTQELKNAMTTSKKYQPISRHPEQYFDLSILTPTSNQAAYFAKLINSCSSLITNVKLVDSFQKKEWVDKKSLTFRITIKGLEAALSREEVDSIIAICKDKLNLPEVQIR